MQTIQAICNYIDAMNPAILLLWIAVALLALFTVIAFFLLARFMRDISIQERERRDVRK